jgi:tRNA A-37 threonylcarbamoyl transferase component Bud32
VILARLNVSIKLVFFVLCILFYLAKDNKYCTKPTKKDINLPCSDKNLEYPISSEDLDLLDKNSLSIDTQSCSTNPSLTCLSVDRRSLIGAGTYGLVVRGRSKTVHFPLAIKFIKLPSKLDVVSFNIGGRYNRIDLNSLIENKGTEKSLREAVTLRLITEYEIPSIPKYVAYFETSSYRILAMELLEGYEELSKIIDKLSTKELLFVSCQTAAIVCNLDQIGISHDDMHERNILIDRKNNNKVNLIDFGGAHFNGKHEHFTSTSNFLKQPINLLGHLKRIVKEDLIDNIQSQEKKEIGRFCSMMQKITTNKNDNEKESIPYDYRILFEKYWKFSQTNKKLFKCALTK